MAKKIETILRDAHREADVAAGLALENSRLRGQIILDAIALGASLKTGPRDPVTGESDMSVAAKR